MDEPKTTFKDTKGRVWSLRVTIGDAMRLRELCQIDVAKITADEGLIKDLIADPWKLVDAIKVLTESQVAAKGLAFDDLAAALDGPTLDEAFDALVGGIAASLGKLQRRALSALVRKLSPGLETLATKIEAKIEATNFDPAI